MTAGRATAAPLAIDLRYEAPRDATCLSEPELEGAIAERLPADVTLDRDAGAPVRITIEIVRDGHTGLRATIALEEQGRVDEASQELVASKTECRTLGIAAALAASLALERAIERASERPRERPPPSPSPSSPAPKSHGDGRPFEPARPERRPSSIVVATHAAGRIGFGILPEPTAGAGAGAAIELSGWRAGLEAVTFLPAQATSPRGGGANASLSMLAATPCRHENRFEVCAVAAVGDLRAAGTGPLLSRSSHAVYVAVGLRAGIEIVRVEPFSFVAQAGVISPLVRPSLRIADELLWRAPVVAGEAGLRWSITIL